MVKKTFSTTKAIAYYRVSTTKQGRDGLGMDAQRASVNAFAVTHGLEIVAAFDEVETGTRKRARPEIARAIAAAKAQNAVLLIAKLDRLARNVAFISGLMEAGVRFVAVDMPQVTNLTLHILAAVAEEEARLISSRTKAALSAARARGIKLGTPANLTHRAQQAGADANRARAITETAKMLNYAHMLRDSGLPLAKVADRLNADGYTSRYGRALSPMTVWRLLNRA